MLKVKKKSREGKEKALESRLDKWAKQHQKSSSSFRKNVNWLFQGGLPPGQTAVNLLVEDFHPYFTHRIKVGGENKSLVCSGSYEVVMKNRLDPENCRICRIAEALDMAALAPRAQYAWFAWVPSIQDIDPNANPDVPTLIITGGQIYNSIYANFIQPRILEETEGKKRAKAHPPLDKMQIIFTKSGKGIDTEYGVSDSGDLVKKGGKLVSDVEIPKKVLKSIEEKEDLLRFEVYLSPKNDEYLDGILKEFEEKIPDSYKVGKGVQSEDEEDEGEFDPKDFIKSSQDVGDLGRKEVQELADHLGIRSKNPKERRKRVAVRVEKKRDKKKG